MTPFHEQVFLVILGVILTGIVTAIGALVVRAQNNQEKLRKLAHTALLKEIENTQKKVADHEAKCDRISKDVLLEKMENLCEKQDNHQSETLRTLASLDSALKEQKQDVRDLRGAFNAHMLHLPDKI